MKVKLFFLSLVFSGIYYSGAFAQALISSVIQPDWSLDLSDVVFPDAQQRKTLDFTGAEFDFSRFGSIPVYTTTINVPVNSLPIIELVNPVYKSVELNDEFIFPSDLHIDYTIAYEKGKRVADIYVPALKKNKSTGEIEKLLSFQLSYSFVSDNSNLPEKDFQKSYATNSVLSSGTWYKIAVSTDGVYKIDKNFLTSLGINTNQINPKRIRIFSAGAGMLPEPNSSPRVDDLSEVSIMVSGESDGQFDDNDFVLFYGQGPHRWMLDTSKNIFIHNQNIYSDYTYYFLNIGSIAGKRVQTVNGDDLLPNQTFTAFDDYAFHEADTANLLKSGRDWYGESFKYILTQNFGFNFPNMLSQTSGKIRMAVASHTITGQGSRYFSTSINGASVPDITIGETCADYTCPAADSAVRVFSFVPNSSSAINIILNYSSNANDASGWLNYIEINVKRALTMAGNEMPFRVISSIGSGNVSQYKIQSSSDILVWNVTDPFKPKQINLVDLGNGYSFIQKSDVLNEYISFTGSSFPPPVSFGKVKNQNLHGSSETDLIIVTPSKLTSSADELAELHRSSDNMKVKVFTTEQIYNEFGGGSPDPTAIRDFVKMFYDRANGDTMLMPKYLLLFGDASFDYKNRESDNTNLVPTFESYESLSTVTSYNTDDYFGFLDNNEGGNMNTLSIKMDIAVGRLPVKNETEAEDVINKIKIYKSSSSLGSWRNLVTFSADDGDSDTHINDCEEIANYVSLHYPLFNIDKIYLDAYRQISTPGGERYPDVNTAINNRIYEGTLIFNYLGHGGATGLAHERILSNEDFDSWTNICKLPLFITATCDFSGFDNPEIVSAGEHLMLNPNGGAIGLVTTVRLVYSFANKDLNLNFMKQVFETKNGNPISMGEALRRGKNNVTSDAINNRKFTLIGDPAISLINSSNQVLTSTIKSQPLNSTPDTLKALEKITVTGYVADVNGNKITDYNGIIYPTVYDKSVTYKTLSNNPGESPVKNFSLRKNLIYNGKASVTNGDFSFTFVVPKDINYQFGFGKFSYYAQNGISSASGYFDSVIVGGTAAGFVSDNSGPQIQIYMNDEKFVFGGMTDESPMLYVKLKDENGINTVGNGIGHDLTGMLDENSQSSFVMNDFYEANLDDYQSGVVKYPLKNISAGRHSVTVKAWDVYNNSSDAYTEFVVATSESMALSHVLNFPNPFTSQTEFMFENNIASGTLKVKIEIYSVSGKLVKTIMTEINQSGSAGCDVCTGVTNSGSFRVNGIMWDGNDDYGDPLAKGVYVYRVSVKSDDGLSATAFEKLVLLK